jgi:hypothetical protein
MTSNHPNRPLIRRFLAGALVVGVTAGLIANWLSGRLADPKANPWSKAAVIAFGVLLFILWFAYLLSREVARLRRLVRAPNISGVSSLRPARSMPELLSDVESELCFMGIIAKRSISDDRFKSFLRKHAGSSLRVRILLLDPTAQVFLDRALEERESAEGWKQELTSTIERLRHYRQLFNVDVQVRLYSLYPIWRLVIIDKRKVIANCFLEGKRGTESDQFLMEDRDSEAHLAHSFVRHFELVWKYHSSSVIL